MPDYEGMPILDFIGEEESSNKSIIKVIGVGGGGGNAVNHMFHQGIHDVSFVICNTDAQALEGSPVPIHLQLGKEGLGAGNVPERARMAAEESADDIRNMLNDGTRMVFITAGMGGGTGTGASPVIARISKEMDILTVGIVTIPFEFEGEKKIIQALDGVEQISKHVDALLVINNERLREIYSGEKFLDAFAKADDTLSIAAKSIAEIITVRGIINLDFNDVKTVLKDGGVALMSTGYGEGEDRVKKAIENALHSPLLNNKNIYSSKKILLSLNFGDQTGQNPFMMDEVNEIHEFMAKFKDFEIKWGVAQDPSLGEQVKVTILATGFGLNNVEGMNDHISKRRTQEDIEKQAADEELRRKQKALIEGYYGPKGQSTPFKQKRYIFYFEKEDLDNDDIIMAIDNSPTFSRSRTMLEEIRKATGRMNGGKEPKSDNISIEGGISFAD